MKKLIFFISLWFSISIQAAQISYSAHVAEIGWMDWVSDGSIAGTTGQERRMEAIKIRAEGLPAGCGITYRAHVAEIGWQDWVTDGTEAGTTGEERRMEAIQIKLVSCDGWQIKYQTHVAELGWLEWVFDGEMSGTVGEYRQIEAIKVELIDKAVSSILDKSDKLFDWAEKEYSQFFSPANQSSQIYNEWYYRYYPETRNYVGVNTESEVWVLGKSWNNQMLYINTLLKLMLDAGLSIGKFESEMDVCPVWFVAELNYVGSDIYPFNADGYNFTIEDDAVFSLRGGRSDWDGLSATFYIHDDKTIIYKRQARLYSSNDYGTKTAHFTERWFIREHNNEDVILIDRQYSTSIANAQYGACMAQIIDHKM